MKYTNKKVQARTQFTDLSKSIFQEFIGFNQFAIFWKKFFFPEHLSVAASVRTGLLDYLSTLEPTGYFWKTAKQTYYNK